MSDFNEKIIEEFRANDGMVGGRFADNRLLLLHTFGADSGEERVNPLVTIENAGKLVIVASNGGAENNPDWYHNILKRPEVFVEYGTAQFSARAEVVDGSVRDELYARMEAAFDNFTTYREETERKIPVITLSRLK